jgi:hypothetical protein
MNEKNINDDFRLYPHSEYMFMGYDQKQNLCVVIKSRNTSRTQLRQKTKMLSIECNVEIEYIIENEKKKSNVHIIRCFSNIEKERILFLELIDATIKETVTDEEIIECFTILSNFFADTKEISDNELTGLFAELDAIIHFSSSLNIEQYWQSKDRMKFDFYFTDNLKLEVKATTKNTRVHHFRHEQLVTEMYDIYVLSYLLRHDDEGVSLLDLIEQVKPLLMRFPKKLIRIERVVKNVGEDRLKELRFSPTYTTEERHVYNAELIPKFLEYTPDGVANAEYDCDMENITYISDEDFIKIVETSLGGDSDAAT